MYFARYSRSVLCVPSYSFERQSKPVRIIGWSSIPVVSKPRHLRDTSEENRTVPSAGSFLTPSGVSRARKVSRDNTRRSYLSLALRGRIERCVKINGNVYHARVTAVNGTAHLH